MHRCFSTRRALPSGIALLIGCSSAVSGPPDPGASDGGSATLPPGEGPEAAAPPSGGPDAGPRPEGGPGGSEAGSGNHADGGAGSGDAGSWGSPGNPGGSCNAGVPAGGKPVDTSTPTSVVGTGSPASCTFDALAAAVGKGGVVTFDCGSAPIALAVTATLNVPTDRDTVIDGGHRITLDGHGAVQVLRFDSANFQANESRLTLQHIAVVNGKTHPTQAIPPAPAPCSQGWDDGEGGGLYMRDGNLTVIDSIFTGNEAATRGPDTGGGAIYVTGSKHGALLVGSTFTGNRASNGAAVGGLFATLDVYDSLFSENVAVGDGANSDDASKCSVINNGQHEVGSGGNGGALYSDGNSVDVMLCGNAITGNAAGAGAFGGGLFFTSDDMMGRLTITDTTMSGNTGGYWTNATSGIMNAGTAIGVNAQSITITNSTLQGSP